MKSDISARKIAQSNASQIEAFNRGYAACHGDLVLFLALRERVSGTASHA